MTLSPRLAHKVIVMLQNRPFYSCVLSAQLGPFSNLVPRALFPGFGGGAPKARESALGTRLALFSKVPIINGPVKPSPFILKIEVSKVLHLA